jgi:hypothetical protein
MVEIIVVRGHDSAIPEPVINQAQLVAIYKFRETA